MSNSNNSSSNRINVPEAKQGMEQFKMRSANEVGVNLKNGYNGDLTSREAGDLGKSPMVKKMCPVRSMKYERQSGCHRTSAGCGSDAAAYGRGCVQLVRHPVG